MIGRFVKTVLPYKDVKDHCSFWPDGCWSDCCHQHDDDYIYGEASKQEADNYLKECVTAAGHPVIAVMMYVGVSTLGWYAWLKHRFRNLKRDGS